MIHHNLAPIHYAGAGTARPDMIIESGFAHQVLASRTPTITNTEMVTVSSYNPFRAKLTPNNTTTIVRVLAIILLQEALATSRALSCMFL